MQNYNYSFKGALGNLCFIAGTLILCLDANGNECYKPIEEIQVGDKVLAYDEETGEQAFKPVLHLFRNESYDWTIVKVNGTEIESTPGHKYYLPETKEWVSAEDLEVGTKVLLSDGTYGIIESVRPIHYDEPQTTYNFEVADFHTYYVGNGVLVHNQNCSGLTRAQEKNIKNIRNNIDDHLKESDITAALGDVQGKPIINTATGKSFQHLKEVKEAYRGVVKSTRALEASLRNPNLSATTRKIISSTVDEAVAYINKLDKLFLPYGGL